MKNALIVDDTKNIRSLLNTCLGLYGYDVTEATCGKDALELFSKNYYDLAFIDIKMPEISGTEVLRQLRMSGNNTPVVIMTAFATVKNAIECTKLGAVSYLQKPFTAEKVKNLLKPDEKFDISQSIDHEFKIESLNCSDKSLDYYLKASKKFILLKNYDSALTMLKSAFSINPTNKELYYLLSQVYEGTKDNVNAKIFKDVWQHLK